MKTFTCLAAIAAATLAVATPAAAQRGPAYGSAQDEEARLDAAQQRFDRETQIYRDAVQRYRMSRPRGGDWRGPGGPGVGYVDPRDDEFYDPVRDYRAPPPGYRDRVLTREDRIYRGQNGQYYCKRNDGTTGLIVGAAAGGLFGNVIAGGRSSTLGTILGAVAGGAIGSSVDRNQEVRCR
ncbi:MAG: glycine zipper 2TM domain-containing protein [Sphingomonas sp.]|uniref:glycine zipper 2TM domain-containing protein n=1 Tax=Sphingomonas sp. TaxID=28214 RepID=UPI0025D492DB|nr:glycine zipper 2TM domain-containing protein [Sphingomonas sp.]MBX3564558.1 glycine zipper 2TM domain-containing protein [Sphingomonas sp.]